MNYRYHMTIAVVLEGDGQHADGDGATATANRLRAALAADPRVLEVHATTPIYEGTEPRRKEASS